jgi:hypothetical protein
MARGPCTFRQADLTRALLATKAAGEKVARVDVNKEGFTIVLTGAAPSMTVDDLDKELSDFEARHGQD